MSFLYEVRTQQKQTLFSWILTKDYYWQFFYCRSSWFQNFHNILVNLASLSKTTKLLLLDSLLQEVCIESGLDGSLTLSLLGLSVCLVSHNLLYSGLKKAFSMTVLGSIRDIKLICQNNLWRSCCLTGQAFQYGEPGPLDLDSL